MGNQGSQEHNELMSGVAESMATIRRQGDSNKPASGSDEKASPPPAPLTAAAAAAGAGTAVLPAVSENSQAVVPSVATAIASPRRPPMSPRHTLPGAAGIKRERTRRLASINISDIQTARQKLSELTAGMNIAQQFEMVTGKQATEHTLRDEEDGEISSDDEADAPEEDAKTEPATPSTATPPTSATAVAKAAQYSSALASVEQISSRCTTPPPELLSKEGVLAF